MRFEYTEPQTPMEKFFGGFVHINAFGQIKPGDSGVFAKFLASTNPSPRTTVYINSGGGDPIEAIQIGRMIREQGFYTSIGQYLLAHEDSNDPVVPRELNSGRCMSAATLMFLGGTLRYFPANAKFGVHQFSFKNPTPDDVARSQVISAQIARFIADMNIPIEFLEVSATTQSSNISLLDRDRLSNLRIVTGGVEEVEWTIRAANGFMYVRGQRDCIFGHQKFIIKHPPGSGFIFRGMVETQGRQSELNSFSVVEITLNGESRRIDISNCLRVESGAYYNFLTKITEDQAREIVLADDVGFQVRFSHEADLFFGIAEMPTIGGKDILRTFFNNFASTPLPVVDYS